MSEESNKVEALLFSSGRKMSEEELLKLTKLKPEQLNTAIEEIKRKHESDESPLVLFNEGSSWKLITKEKYLSLIQNVVTETELDKSLMETLAVIAWKYPILQSDVIKLRNNKAYEHLRELEESGFIAREKKGRTRSIKLTPKFFEYFDLPPSKAKTQDAFKEIIPQDIRVGVEKTESEIEQTEKEIEERKRQKEELEQKMRDEKKRLETEVDLVDEITGKKTKLDIYESKEIPKDKDKLGMMDVYGEDQKNIKPGDPKISEAAAEKRVQEIEKEEITPEVQKVIDKMTGQDKVPEKKGDLVEQEPKEELPEEVKEEEKELMPEKKKEEISGEIEENTIDASEEEKKRRQEE